MPIQDTPPHLQPVRRVRENGEPFSSSNTIIHVVCHPDTASGKDILLWDDILAVFSNALYIRSGNVALPFLKGSNFKNLDPLRFAAVPGITLDVVVKDSLVRAEALSQPENSSTSPIQELSLRSLQKELPDTAEENSNRNPVSTSNTVVTTTKRNPVYGLENAAMDNYTHIDMPDDIRALSHRMILEHCQEQAKAGPNSTNIAVTSATATVAAIISPPSETAVQLKSRVKNACKNTNNLAEPPSSRGPQALPSEQLTSTTSDSALHSPQNSTIKIIPPRAPQESASNATEHVATTIKNARLGDRFAQATLGAMYRNGDGVEQDYHQAKYWLLQAAKQGNSAAQYSVGWMYQSGGHGLSQDYQQALYWFRKAADQGYLLAQYQLGFIYDQGHKVSPDYPQAFYWFRKAAEQGRVDSQYYLGFMYETGRGVLQDYSQSVIWYLKAANQGDKISQYNVGLSYLNGSGIVQDYSRAMVWFRKSADQGYAEGLYMVGYMYSGGLGVARDNSLAMEWFLKAANKGLMVAQYNVGVLYDLGKGVEKDETKAVEWFEKAADRGHADARKKLHRLRRQDHGL